VVLLGRGGFDMKAKLGHPTQSDLMKRQSEKRMSYFDQLPKWAREKINRDGVLGVDGIVRLDDAGKHAYFKHMMTYMERL
jgi:hypothetical protein